MVLVDLTMYLAFYQSINQSINLQGYVVTLSGFSLLLLFLSMNISFCIVHVVRSLHMYVARVEHVPL